MDDGLCLSEILCVRPKDSRKMKIKTIIWEVCDCSKVRTTGASDGADMIHRLPGFQHKETHDPQCHRVPNKTCAHSEWEHCERMCAYGKWPRVCVCVCVCVPPPVVSPSSHSLGRESWPTPARTSALNVSEYLCSRAWRPGRCSSPSWRRCFQTAAQQRPPSTCLPGIRQHVSDPRGGGLGNGRGNKGMWL